MLRNRERFAIGLLALLALNCLPDSAWAQKGGKGGGGGGNGGNTKPTYVITWLGTLGGTETWLGGINSRGDIWGGSMTTPADDESHPFIIFGQGDGQMIDFYDVLLDAGHITPFDWDTLTGTYRVGIQYMNDSGQLVGTLQEATNGEFLVHTYVYRPDSATPFVIISTDQQNNGRVLINNHEVVAGFSDTRKQAYYWTEATGIQYLDVSDSPKAINTSGVLCGYFTNAWKYDPLNGYLWLFDTSPRRSTALGINDNGQIAGTYQERDSSYPYAYRMAADGSYTLIKMPKNYPSEGWRINGNGDVLGRGHINGSWRPILYKDTTGVIDLFGQTVNLDLPEGTNYGYAYPRGINDSGVIVGEIVGHKTILGSSSVAFILTPSE